MTPEEEQKLRNFRLLGGGSPIELPQQQQQPTAPLLGQAQASPNILSQVPGIGNVRPNPMFQQNLEAPGAAGSNAAPDTPPTNVLGRAKQSISEAWDKSALGQFVQNSSGQEVYDVGNNEFSIRNRFLGVVGEPVPFEEASPEARNKAIAATLSEGYSEREPDSFALGFVPGQNQSTQGSNTPMSQEQVSGIQGPQAQPPQFSLPNGATNPLQRGIEMTAPAPEATFLSEGQTKTIMPGQPVREAFPNNPETPLVGGPLNEGQPTFQGTDLPGGIGFQRAPEGMVKSIGPDGKMIFTTQEEANRIADATNQEQSEANAAQQRFLQSPAADAMSNRMIQSVRNSPFEQASADLQARIAERPDFNEPQASQNVPQDVLEAAANPRPTPQQQARLAQWEKSTQGQQMGGVQGLQPERTDDRTPEQVENERLQNERLQQIITKGNQPDATPFEKELGAQEQKWQSAQEAGVLKDWEVDALRKDFYRKPPPKGGYSSWAEFEAEKRGEETPTGATGGAGDSTPGASTLPENMPNPNDFSGKKVQAPDGNQYRSDGSKWTKV